MIQDLSLTLPSFFLIFDEAYKKFIEPVFNTSLVPGNVATSFMLVDSTSHLSLERFHAWICKAEHIELLKGGLSS